MRLCRADLARRQHRSSAFAGAHQPRQQPRDAVLRDQPALREGSGEAPRCPRRNAYRHRAPSPGRCRRTGPLMAAMIGFFVAHEIAEALRIARNRCRGPGRSAMRTLADIASPAVARPGVPARACDCPRAGSMSAPAQKPRPAPVSTMTRTRVLHRIGHRALDAGRHGAGIGVEAVGPVERDRRDAVLHVIQDVGKFGASVAIRCNGSARACSHGRGTAAKQETTMAADDRDILFETPEPGVARVTLNRPDDERLYRPRCATTWSPRCDALYGGRRSALPDPHRRGPRLLLRRRRQRRRSRAAATITPKQLGYGQEMRGGHASRGADAAPHRQAGHRDDQRRGGGRRTRAGARLRLPHRRRYRQARRHSGRFGLLPDEGGAWFFPRAMGLDRALKMTMLHEVYPATQALALGLVTEVVPAAELETHTLALRACRRETGAARRAIGEEHDAPRARPLRWSIRSTTRRWR